MLPFIQIWKFLLLLFSINAVKITTAPLDQMFFAFAVDVIEHWGLDLCVCLDLSSRSHFFFFSLFYVCSF